MNYRHSALALALALSLVAPPFVTVARALDESADGHDEAVLTEVEVELTAPAEGEEAPEVVDDEVEPTDVEAESAGEVSPEDDPSAPVEDETDASTDNPDTALDVDDEAAVDVPEDEGLPESPDAYETDATGEVVGLRAQAAKGWVRLWGQTAYDTMVAIVDKANFAKGGTVIVATGNGYWDALAASGLAGLLDAPVLITPKGSLAAQTISELKKLAPARVLVMGGSAAISDEVVAQIKQLVPDTKRVFGETAPDTAVEIWRAGAAEGAWGNTAVVATCNGYWDALSIAPFSYAQGAPIFLTQSAGKSDDRILGDAALAAIKEGGFSRVIIVGGTAAVSKKVEAQLSGAGVGSVKRLWGETALDTSAEIAKWELNEGLSLTNLTVATSGGYWDALTGAALAGRSNSVLVLVSKDGNFTALDAVYDYAGNAVDEGRILGGTEAVPAAAAARIEAPWALKSADVSAQTVKAGSSVTVTAKLSGNPESASYAYSWRRNGSTAAADNGSAKTSSASQSFTFSKPGSYVIEVKVTDAGGKAQTATSTVQVWSLTSLSVSQQQNGNFVAAVDLGCDEAKLSGFTYRYTWSRSGASGTISDWSSKTSVSFNPSVLGNVGGAYTLSCEVRKDGSSVGTLKANFSVDAMVAKAQSFSSPTNYLILVDCDACKVGVFQGSKGSWKLIRYMTCSTGKESTPTIKGTFSVGYKGYVFGSYYSCYYYTQFYGDYLFHTIKYEPGTFEVMDGRLGEHVSEGCVRLALENAKWIYDNVPYASTVHTY